MCLDCGCGLLEKPKVSSTSFKGFRPVPQKTQQNPKDIKADIRSLSVNILAENDSLAEKIRQQFKKNNVIALNMMSSPGSGKTTLLEKTAELWPVYFQKNGRKQIAVIGGDLQTQRDTERLLAKGIHAKQITTGTGCHLDAQLIERALVNFALENGSLLFIENVGNLVCPAVYDVGAHVTIALLSVSEGDDKVEKYPLVFADADLIVITKLDLLAYCNFSIEKIKADIQNINPEARIITTALNDVKSFAPWFDFLKGYFVS